jgi:enamine deaminase RidA (YjgF/YER057c/UK114 family)
VRVARAHHLAVAVGGGGAADEHAVADPHGQTTYILDKISACLAACGASLEHVVRTRIYLRSAEDWEPVSREHGRVFGDTRPANTLVEARLVGDYLVEIEAEAVIG